VIQKVQRRLQHFIDRKIAAQFEPLLALRATRRSPAWRAASRSSWSRRYGIDPALRDRR
jgi:hypothetical protein